MLVCPTNFDLQVVISAEGARIVQDTQQPCEQSDKQVDASELLPQNRATGASEAFRRGGLGLDVHPLGRSQELQAHRLLFAHLAPCPGLLPPIGPRFVSRTRGLQ